MSSTPTSYGEDAPDAPVNPAHLREKLAMVKKWLETDVAWITAMDENSATFVPENPAAFVPENPVATFHENDACDTPDRVKRLKTSLNKLRGIEQRAK
jgi:hypothetical protein